MDDAQTLKAARPKERRRVLMDYVVRLGSAQIDELAARFGVSRMTVHRDLTLLEEQGVVRRVHGGVAVRSPDLVESTCLYRSRPPDHVEDAIVAAAAEMIEPGQAIIIDDSTTAGRLTTLIPARKPLTVITNSQTVVDRLKNVHGIETISLGGHYSTRFSAFFGMSASRRSPRCAPIFSSCRRRPCSAAPPITSRKTW